MTTKTKLTNIDKLEVIDEAEIARYDKESKGKFYIPPFELEEGIDKELVDEGTYVLSAESIGKHLTPIYVAVSDDDPEKDSEASYTRIHLRIIDGRTRYLQSLNKKMSWPVKYIHVKDFEQFFLLWTHFNSKKENNKKDEKNKIIQYCKSLEKQGFEKAKIGSTVVKNLSEQGQFSKIKLYRLIPDEYKSSVFAKLGRKGGLAKAKEQKEKKKSKKDKQIEELEARLHLTIKESINNEELLKTQKPIIEKWNDLERYLQQTHKVKINGTRKQVYVKFNLDTKEISIDEIVH